MQKYTRTTERIKRKKRSRYVIGNSDRKSVLLRPRKWLFPWNMTDIQIFFLSIASPAHNTAAHDQRTDSCIATRARGIRSKWSTIKVSYVTRWTWEINNTAVGILRDRRVERDLYERLLALLSGISNSPPLSPIARACTVCDATEKSYCYTIRRASRTFEAFKVALSKTVTSRVASKSLYWSFQACPSFFL